MSTAIKWEGAGTKLPDGHRIFETHDNGHGEHGWAIADESGRLPQNTDDGVLWLDPTRCLDVSTKWAPTIPLLDNDGERTRTTTDAPTIFMLARMLRWTVQDEIRGHFYNVT